MAAPATITVFDNLYDFAGNAIAKAPVSCVLNSSQETTSGGLILPKQQSTTTDNAGRFAFTVVANDLLSPANSTYTIITPFRQYDIAPQSANGSSQQTTAVNVIVNTPSALAPSTSSITGPLTISGTLTVSGLVTAQAGLTVSGGTFSIPSGGFSMAGPLTLTAAASAIIPGATSFSVRDTGNANDNLLVSNAGLVTVRNGLTVTAGNVTVTAGSLTMTAGQINVPTLIDFTGAAAQISGGSASLSLRNNANSADNLLVSDAGAVTVRNGLTVTAGGAIITAGNLTLTAGSLNFSAAAAQIVPGATSLALRNNANNANNLLVTDAGLVTLRNALSMPPSAGGALPTTTFGTVSNLLDSQSGSGVASLTLNVTGGNQRSILLQIEATSNQAGTTVVSVQFNGDTGANYDTNFLQNANATLSGGSATAGGTSGRIALATGTGAAAGAVAATSVQILNADSTTQRKNWQYVSNLWSSDAAAGALYEAGEGQWRNTANAVTSIKLIPAAGTLTIRARAYSLP